MSTNLGEEGPQFHHYPDRGCEVAPKCLECPLPQCRFDDPRGYLRILRQQKDAQFVWTMEQQALSVEEAAELFGLTVRTIFRIKRRQRELST